MTPYKKEYTECWINIYDDKGAFTFRWPSRQSASLSAKRIVSSYGLKLLYRIHVRLK